MNDLLEPPRPFEYSESRGQVPTLLESSIKCIFQDVSTITGTLVRRPVVGGEEAKGWDYRVRTEGEREDMP